MRKRGPDRGFRQERGAQTMMLTPTEQERLTIFAAAELARKHRALGIRLSHPEAVAYICDELLYGARLGRPLAELMSRGSTLLTSDDVLPGVADMLPVLNIEGMFPDGAKEPYDRTRRIIRKLAGPLKALPNRVSITGHTAASRQPPRPGYGPWELSAERANAVRQILEDEGLPSSHVFMISGKADSQPLFPDDPHIAANRRVTITLMREAPPLPTGFKP